MGRILTVNFRKDTLYAFDNDDGTFVALKPIVEGMGLDWSAQLKRVKRDAILSEGMAIMATPFGRGGDQDSVCLKLELVNGWLFTIDSSRIKDPDVREKVLLYQRECYAVLDRHFRGGKSAAPTTIEHVDGDDSKQPTSVRRQLVSEARQTFGHKSAGQLWFKLGLTIVPAMLEGRPQLELFDYSRIKTIGDDEQEAA